MTPEEQAIYSAECVRIEPLAIEEEYIRLPSDLAYWSAELARAIEQSALAKNARELTAAEVAGEKREDLHALNGKAPTVAQVEEAVTTDHRYQKAKHAEITTESRRMEILGTVEAIRAKRDMLISLGAHIRAELQRDPLIRSGE